MQGHVQSKLLLDNRHQDIDSDGDPNLRPHSVLGGAVVTLDELVLLDPLEEQFHLPSAPVQGADGRCWQGKLVAQEHQVLAGTQRDWENIGPKLPRRLPAFVSAVGGLAAALASCRRVSK